MKERIKELAEQATTIEYGADCGFDRVTFDKEKFADLIRADEREACAKLCDKQAEGAYWEGADACAELIRARENTND
jgi:hypothetical protein